MEKLEQSLSPAQIRTRVLGKFRYYNAGDSARRRSEDVKDLRRVLRKDTEVGVLLDTLSNLENERKKSLDAEKEILQRLGEISCTMTQEENAGKLTKRGT